MCCNTDNKAPFQIISTSLRTDLLGDLLSYLCCLGFTLICVCDVTSNSINVKRPSLFLAPIPPPTHTQLGLSPTVHFYKSSEQNSRMYIIFSESWVNPGLSCTSMLHFTVILKWCPARQLQVNVNMFKKICKGYNMMDHSATRKLKKKKHLYGALPMQLLVSFVTIETMTKCGWRLCNCLFLRIEYHA